MNKKEVLKFQIFSIIFVSILGTLLHFAYEWLGDNKIIAAFSAVNESTWEHLKLLFFPMLITTIIGYFSIGKNISNFLCAKTVGIITAILFVIIFFYTYTGVIGTNFAVLDIGSFFIAVILGEYVAYKIMISDNNKFKCNKNLSITVLIILFIAFVVFTYYTPRIGLFKDPVTEGYANLILRVNYVKI